MQETRREILISIKPKWVALILSGRKTVEIRKRFPKDYRGWVYIYCTKDDTQRLHKNIAGIYWIESGSFRRKNKTLGIAPQPYLNGKVVGRFWCGQVEEFYEFNNDLCEKACIGRGEILDYLGDKNGFAIHISKLEIYGEPKELSEFKSYKKNIVNTKINGMVFETELDNSLIKAPQNFCYVEVEK